MITVNPPNNLGDVTYTLTYLDNLGEASETDEYLYRGTNLTYDIGRAQGTPQVLHTGDTLLARSTSLFDTVGQVYESRQYAVASGSAGDYLPTDNWYDLDGNVLATRTGAGTITKSVYDGAGELIDTYTSANQTATGNLNYTQATTLQLNMDTVVQQTQTWYDADGNAVLSADYQMLPGTQLWTGMPLTALNSYVSVTASYYDAAGRDIEDVNYGRQDLSYGNPNMSQTGAGLSWSSSNNGTATVTLNNDYSVGDYVSISGASHAFFNGVFMVASATSTSFTYADPNGSVTTDSGTVSLVSQQATGGLSWSNGTATVSVPNTAGFYQGNKWVLITGASPAAYNGWFQVFTANSSSFTYHLPSSTNLSSSSTGNVCPVMFNTSGQLAVDANGLPLAMDCAAPPTISSDYNVTQTVYNNTSATGPIVQSINNAGFITQTQFDLMGRTITTIQDYDAAGLDANTGLPVETDMGSNAKDVTVGDFYDTSGRLLATVAYNAKGAGNGVELQTTTYLYESNIDGSLCTNTIYADSTDTPSNINISSTSKSSGVVTVTTASNHGLLVGDWVLVQGVSDTVCDGWFQVTKCPVPRASGMTCPVPARRPGRRAQCTAWWPGKTPRVSAARARPSPSR